MKQHFKPWITLGIRNNTLNVQIKLQSKIILKITKIYEIVLSISYVRAGEITFRIILKKIKVTFKRRGKVLNQSLTLKAKQVTRYLL